MPYLPVASSGLQADPSGFQPADATVLVMSSTPDLTTYRAVHAALRGSAHAMTGADTRTKAFAKYWKGYAGEVLAHHTVEDDYFFPALVARVPFAAGLIERTDAD